ncbi:MAG: PfkB family carbohydrate kinase, partial [Mycoplasmatales bacterium]
MSQEKYITVIGVSNIDIHGKPNDKLKARESNIGNVSFSLGGVTRNISENLALLGSPVKFISDISNYLFGKSIIENANERNFDISNSIYSDYTSSTYLSMCDETGDMLYAINDMKIIDTITKEELDKRINLIEGSPICVIDTALNKELFEYLVNNFKANFYLDTVSAVKAIKAKDVLNKIHTIKPNNYEAKVLSGIEVNNDEDAFRAADWFIVQGIQNVVITLGKNGVIYKT